MNMNRLLGGGNS